jgi:hypothetical protein
MLGFSTPTHPAMSRSRAYERLQKFASEEILDELIRRVGPVGAVDEFNRHASNPVSSIAEIRGRLSDAAGTIW